MQRRRKMDTDSATPLRKSTATQALSDEQETYLGAFLAAALVGGVGIYATQYQASGSIKVRLYSDGERYEDTLDTREDFLPLFDDYSKQLGFQAHFRAIVARVHPRRAERAAEAPLGGAEGEDTGPAGSKPLRTSQRP